MIRWVAPLSIIVVVLVLPVVVVVEDRGLQRSIHAQTSSKDTGDALQVQSYVSGDNDELPSQLSPRARSHLEDVRSLVGWAHYAVVVASLAGVAGAVMSRGVMGRSAWGLVGVVAVAIATAAWFDTAFYVFHELFFSGESYRFPSSSYLIELFPRDFFEGLGRSLVVGWLATAGSAWFVSLVER